MKSRRRRAARPASRPSSPRNRRAAVSGGAHGPGYAACRRPRSGGDHRGGFARHARHHVDRLGAAPGGDRRHARRRRRRARASRRTSPSCARSSRSASERRLKAGADSVAYDRRPELLTAGAPDAVYSRVRNTLEGRFHAEPTFVSRVRGSRPGGRIADEPHRVRQSSRQDSARHPAVDGEVRSRKRPRRHAAQGLCGGFPRNRIRRLLRQESRPTSAS